MATSVPSSAYRLTKRGPPPGVVHLWRVSLAPPPGREPQALYTLLSPEERARADKFHFELHRRRYVVAHAALREILGRYLDGPPLTEGFSLGRDGKPFLGRASPLRFNLAHSEDQAVVAVTTRREVGVDVEAVREDVEIESVAGQFFSAPECEALLALPEEARRNGFFHIWSQKEAYLKGRGDGVVHGLDHFDVVADPHRPAGLLADRRDPAALECWVLTALDVGPGFRGALAIEAPAGTVVTRQWP